MAKTWMPTVAGILTIIAGLTRLFGGIMILILGWLGDGIFDYLWYGLPGYRLIPFGSLGLVAVPVMIAAVLALLGGIFTILRRNWSLVLVGSICGAFLTWFLGIPALVLVAMSKKEYA